MEFSVTQRADRDASGYAPSMLRALCFTSLLCLALSACGSDGQIDLGAGGAGASAGGGTGGVAGNAADAAVGCSSSAQCVGERAFCELTSGQCVECLVAGHCSESDHSCDIADFHCKRSCLGDPDCSSGSEPFCEATRKVCIECRIDADCSSGSDSRCLTTTGKCVECRGDADCSNAEKPFCPLTRNECSECLVDGHCPAGKRCDRSDFQCRD